MAPFAAGTDAAPILAAIFGPAERAARRAPNAAGANEAEGIILVIFFQNDISQRCCEDRSNESRMESRTTVATSGSVKVEWDRILY